MSLTHVGQGLWPLFYLGSSVSSDASLRLLNLADEAYGAILLVPYAGELRYIWFRQGATAVAGSAYIAIKTVDPTTGLPTATDHDAACTPTTFTVATGNAGTGQRVAINGGADCTLTAGEIIAITFQNTNADPPSWGIAATYGLTGVSANVFDANQMPYGCAVAGGGTTTWSKAYYNVAAQLALEYADGTVVVPLGCSPVFGAYSALTFKQDSATNKYGMRIQVPFECRAQGLFAGSFDYDYPADLKLYNAAGTLLRTASLTDADYRYTTASGGVVVPFTDGNGPITIAANTTYYVMVEPTGTAGNTGFGQYTLYEPDAPDIMRSYFPGGVECFGVSGNSFTSGTDAGVRHSCGIVYDQINPVAPTGGGRTLAIGGLL